MKRKLWRNLTAALLCAVLFLTAAAPAMAADALVQPSEAFIIECLETVSEVAVIGPVTESNDPNGKLNAPDGYTAAVFFSSPLVRADAASMTSAEVIDAGTSCGGCVEVYRTEADAKTRYEYLQSLKALAGDSVMIGTVVVRTSFELDAGDSERLKNAIVAALEEKAYGGETAAAPAAPAEEPAAELDIDRMVQNYLFQNIYLEFTMAALSNMDIAGAGYTNVADHGDAVVHQTIDGNGYYVFEYNVTEADEQVHVTRITFVSTFDKGDISTVALSVAAICSAVGVLPTYGTEDFVEEAAALMTAIDNGQSYTSGNATVSMLWDEMDDRLMVTMVIDGLDSL